MMIADNFVKKISFLVYYLHDIYNSRPGESRRGVLGDTAQRWADACGVAREELGS